MSIIALLAAVKALFVCAYWTKWAEQRRQRTLTGGNTRLVRTIPIVDSHLKHSTRSATKTQVFIARELARLCRQVAHTSAFEYVLLQVIQAAVKKHRSKAYITKPEVVL